MSAWKTLQIALGLLVFVFGGVSVSAACTSCARFIELTKQELACLELFLPSYLAETADPVIVSLIACSQKSAMQASRSARSDPVLKPIVDPNGDSKASEKVYFLTKKQIICLQEKMGSLKRRANKQIKFDFGECKV